LNFQSAERVRFLLGYVNIFLLVLVLTRKFKIDTKLFYARSKANILAMCRDDVTLERAE
jgi:hypothetical protein